MISGTTIDRHDKLHQHQWDQIDRYDKPLSGSMLQTEHIRSSLFTNNKVQLPSGLFLL